MVNLKMELSEQSVASARVNFIAADAAAIAAIRRIVREAGEIAYDILQDTVHVQRGNMKRFARLEFSPAQFAFELGWRAEDFFNANLQFYPPVEEDRHPALGPAYDIVSDNFSADIAAEINASLARAAAQRRRRT